MLKRITMCLLAIVMVLSLVACGLSESKDDNSSTLTPEDLGLQPTKTNYTRDFDSTTNQTITFGDIMFQIPKGWSTGDSTDVAIQINGLSESQAGPMWLELLNSGMSEDDLASAACQQAISDAYVAMMEQSFENVKITNSNYNSQSQLYFMNIEASAYNIPAECGVCAFVENGNLYVYLVPFMEGDQYDYSLDVQEIVKSVSSVVINIDMPDEFDIIAEENLSVIPEKSALDDIIDNALNSIGVESDEYRAYGNYLDFTALFIDIFVVTDTNKSLMVNAFFNPSSEKWNIQSINDVIDDRYYYVRPDAAATFDIYDYKTGELISKQSMTQEEFDEELKKQQEEAEKKYQEEIDKLLENYYGLKTSDTTDIAVRFETDYIDGDRLHITVFTKNNTEEVFAGNVYVTFYSADGKDRLGSDTIIVDELLPGRESWADIIVDAYRGTPKMTVDFSEVSFTPIKEVVSEIDLDATEKTKSSYYWNFDGVSWYNDITDIAVYENGTCVVVLKDNPKEGGQFYASTIWSCGNDHGVDTVQVVDAKGTIIAVYGNGEMVSVSVSNGEIVSESNISTEVQGTEPTENQTTSCSHSWNSGETTKKATCSETGIKTYTCLKCSEKKTETIPKTDHTYDAGKVSKNPTCTDVGKITYTCSACKAQYSEDVEKIAHTWDNGKVKNAATCTLEGTMEYQCTTCATTKTESIPLIAHSYTEKIISDKYLQTPASFTSGSIYSYSCSCGAKGNSTFTTDDRNEWISHSEIRNILGYGMGYNSKELYRRIDVGPGYPPTRYYIYNIPAEENMVVGEVYTGTCDGYTIRIKAEKAYNSSQFYDYLFFHYDDLVVAGII